MGSVERNLSGKSEKVEHFSLLDGTFLVGISGLGEEGGRESLAREIFTDN